MPDRLRKEDDMYTVNVTSGAQTLSPRLGTNPLYGGVSRSQRYADKVVFWVEKLGVGGGAVPRYLTLSVHSSLVSGGSPIDENPLAIFEISPSNGAERLVMEGMYSPYLELRLETTHVSGVITISDEMYL